MPMHPGREQDEVQFHLESRVDELVARGMSRDEAWREARSRFGDVEQITSTLRTLSAQRETDMRRTERWQGFTQDVRYAARQLRRAPMLTLIATLTIALGIGANTAIFSVVNRVLLEPLPYAHPDRLMLLEESTHGSEGNVSVGNFASWRERSRSFEAMSAATARSFNLTGSGEPQRIVGARVTASFFKTNYMAPAIGRYFVEDEDRPGGGNVVVLSNALWKSQFGGARDVIGRDLQLNGEPYRVIGVAPAGYTLTPEDEQLWVPAQFTPEQIAQHDEHYLTVFGLLKPGVSQASATREMSAIQSELHQQFPMTGTADAVLVTPLKQILVRDYRTQLLVLLGAVGFVLLIACGNVANLLLARSAARQKEIAIRAALGAGRGRIVTQLLTESVMLAVLGGVAGLLIGYAGIRFLVSMSPAGVPRLGEAGLDGRVLAFTAIVTLVCGVAFGLAPALRAVKTNLQGTLREGGRDSGPTRDKLRAVLVVAEVAVAVVLLTGAGLLVRSAMLLQGVRPGFDPTNVLSFRVTLPATRYGDPQNAEQTFERIIEAVRAVPGVRAAALASSTPFANGNSNGLIPEGRTMDIKSAINSTMRIVTPNYLETMRIPLVRGRGFNDRDVAASPRVMLVNEAFAKQAWPGQDPIGKRVSCCEGNPDGSPVWKEVVGIVGDVRAWGLGAEVQPEFYLPLTQTPKDAWRWMNTSLTVVARTSGSPSTLAKPAQRAVWSIDPTVPIYRVYTLDQLISRSTESTRFDMLLLTLLGVTGLVLAAVGIYGVIAYFVSQRTRELGIRMALGASGAQVQQMVVRQGAALALIGLAVGVPIALGLTRVLADLLYGVSPHDPVTIIVVGALLAAVAIVASYIPARRATRIDPLMAMR